MKRYILALFIVIFSSQVWAAEGQFEHLVLSKAPVDHFDIESIKRGAKFFATTCMSCHTLKYLRYDKLAQEQGVIYDKMPLNVTKWPNDITPPDLSLEASVRGVDWIYTYLHSFYNDPSRPSGINNLLVPNTGMSNILGPYYGEQELVNDPGANGVYSHTIEWYGYLNLVHEGSMTPQDYDQLTIDITNFLAYASEPYYIDQHHIGWWVLGFLLIFTTMMYFLKKEYWKDVK
ncbi:MAG TPA: cytochrome c1, partial [Gammaproteobacteria bacterium]|nr:cytochrome c1 [Gammaproteobacteria bacterium]